MRSLFFGLSLMIGFSIPMFEPGSALPLRSLTLSDSVGQAIKAGAPRSTALQAAGTDVGNGVEPSSTPRGKASPKPVQGTKKPPSRVKAPCKGVDEGYRALVQQGPGIVRSFTWCPGDVSPETAGYRAYQAEIQKEGGR